jgi:hypothetical protein
VLSSLRLIACLARSADNQAGRAWARWGATAPFDVNVKRDVQPARGRVLVDPHEGARSLLEPEAIKDRPILAD